MGGKPSNGKILHPATFLLVVRSFQLLVEERILELFSLLWMFGDEAVSPFPSCDTMFNSGYNATYRTAGRQCIVQTPETLSLLLMNLAGGGTVLKDPSFLPFLTHALSFTSLKQEDGTPLPFPYTKRQACTERKIWMGISPGED